MLMLIFLNVSMLMLRHGVPQNDLVHGWGMDLALRRCVEVLDESSAY